MVMVMVIVEKKKKKKEEVVRWKGSREFWEMRVGSFRRWG
jgi:hypothetical protein